MSDRTVIVPAGEAWIVGVLDTDVYGQTDDSIYLDSAATILVTAFLVS